MYSFSSEAVWSTLEVSPVGLLVGNLYLLCIVPLDFVWLAAKYCFVV